MPTEENKTNQHESTQKVVDTAAKGAAEYFAPGVGGKVYDMAKKTPIVGKNIDRTTQKAAKKIDRIPGVQRATQGLNNSGMVDAANKGIDLISQSQGAGVQESELNQASQLAETVQKEQEGVEKQGSTPLLNSGKSNRTSQSSGTGKGETDGGDITDLFGKIKKYKTYIYGGCGALGCLGILFVIVFIVFALKYVGDLFTIDNILGNISTAITDFADGVANTFSGCWFQGKEECTETQRNKFFKEVEKVHKRYQERYQINLDSALIVATLTYKDMDQILGDGDYEYDTNGDAMDILKSSEIDATDYRVMRRYIDALADHMAPLEWVRLQPDEEEDPSKQHQDIKEKDKDGNEITVRLEKRRHLDLEAYKEYLMNEFVPKYYYPKENKDEIPSKIRQTVDDIYDRREFYKSVLESATSLRSVSSMCRNGITVIDSSGAIVGNYDLETYIAGVISGEAYPGQDEDAYKAQAIASRTYALYYTNNCSQPIVNTDAAQVFNSNIRDYARKGAEDTAGLVLVYDGNIFSAQYDSFCYGDSRCPDAHYDEVNNVYTVTYTRLPDKSTHEISISADYYNKFTHKGHAHGMSQLKSYEMAKNGDDYETILKYFYSDGVEIRNMSAIFSGDFGHENGKDGLIEVIDGVFHLPKDSQGKAGTEGTQGNGQIYNAGYNAVFEARLEALRLAAQQAGYTITIPTGPEGAWRPYKQQAIFYNCYLTKQCNNGNPASAPGYGQHGWGIAADLKFGSQAAITWVHEHAIEFDLHFPVSSENWHIEPTRIVRDL